MILVGDIGGTNTTIAAIEQTQDAFTIVHKERFRSASISGVHEAIEKFNKKAGRQAAGYSACCLSAAGPVRDNVCTMTNVPWSIDGNDEQKRLGIRTFIINDFSAICYALPLINGRAQIETVEFPHPDGSRPAPRGTVRAVVGAGTGLGTGYLIEDRGHYTAHPSEGGHSSFAATDGDMLVVKEYLDAFYSVRPGAEQYVSGQGIRNIYNAFRSAGRLGDDHVTRDIDKADDSRKPELIAEAATGHAGLAEVMRLFVRMYAQYASNTALVLLPGAGLYLAGGIAAKNERWFLEDHLFMRTFERNYNDRITPLLRSTPVVLIKDYAVSLYGAAHAAVSLS